MAQQQVAKQNQPATHWYGGCTYLYEGQPLFTHRPPAGLQCQVLSNAAILNHGGIDRAPSQITGRPHYFIGVAAGDGEGFNWLVEPPQGPVFFAPLSGHFG